MGRWINHTHGLELNQYSVSSRLGFSVCEGSGDGVCAPLTLTAAPVRCQLESWVAGTSVAAQRVQTALLALAVVWPGALVRFCRKTTDPS